MVKKKLTEEQIQKNRENGKLGGRPPKYPDAQALEAKIDEYFNYYETIDKAPTWANMLLYIDISDDTLLRYRTDEEYINKGYADAIKKAEKRHCDFWQQLCLEKPNLQTFCIFELKQPHNGGFSDKQQIENTGKQSMEITFKTI